MPRRYIDRRAETEIEAMLKREAIARSKAEEQTAEQASDKHAAPKKGGGQHRTGDWQGLVEQRILDGMERGMFDNLQGTGQPLNLDDDQFVPFEYRMAFRMLKSTGLAPLWVDMNKEIRADIERLHRFRDHIHGRWAEISVIELEHRRAEYAERIAAINSKILSYNIIAPSSHVHLGLLLAHEEMAQFDQPPQASDTMQQ